MTHQTQDVLGRLSAGSTTTVVLREEEPVAEKRTVPQERVRLDKDVHARCVTRRDAVTARRSRR